MTTAFNLRKTLHRKAFEFCAPSIANTGAGSFFAGDNDGLMPTNEYFYFVNGASGIYNYNVEQDAHLQLPNSGIAGAFGAGANGEFRRLGMLGGTPTNTATAGTVNTITTNKIIVRSLKGCKVRVVAGTGSGYEGTVSSNTYNTNAILTVTPNSAVAFDATTVFQVFSGALWFFCPGSSSVGFSVYDCATNTWTAKAVTNLPTAWGTAGQLIGTGSLESGAVVSGTRNGTADNTTTLTDAAKTWTANMWANYQVRIISGTGAGQVRTVASNTTNVLTVATAWTTTPDNTSVYAVEGNDDFLYLFGNGAVTAYRYSLSANTWTVLSPVAARTGSFNGGGTAEWIGALSDAEWISGQPAKFRQNGRYIYSFRGGGTNTLDIYDIAGNTWLNNILYGNQMETFATGSCSVQSGDFIYIMKEGTGRLYIFDVAKQSLFPFTNNIYPQSTTVEGDKMAVGVYKDGGTTIRYLYLQQHSRNDMQRLMVI